MYILLQKSLNLTFNITTYYVDIFHVSTKRVLISTTTLLRRPFMNTHPQKQHNKKRNSTRRKERYSFVYEYCVH